jgi:uncharacterized Fe-S center protein
MTRQVFFFSLEKNRQHDGAPGDLSGGLNRLVAALRLAGAAGDVSPWGLKVQLGAQSHSAAVAPAWARAVADGLVGTTGVDPTQHIFCFDTLSISTLGLDRAETHLGTAKVKGYGPAGNGLPYLVADGPDQGPSLIVNPEDDPELAGLTLAGALDGVGGLCLLTPVRPHPHVGFTGAVTGQGPGLADFQGKLMLHQDIRPKVDTPLCAGCGSCLSVCLFDAITIEAGRATISHEKCTGCGECMNVCFMAGISAEEAASIPRFQRKVAGAALAARRRLLGERSGRAGYFNLLVRLDRHAGGAQARGRQRLGDVGILASRDPVAVDQAAWDLIVARISGPLSSWSGFRQDPGILLERAEQLGLGTRTYSLVEI